MTRQNTEVSVEAVWQAACNLWQHCELLNKIQGNQFYLITLKYCLCRWTSCEKGLSLLKRLSQILLPYLQLYLHTHTHRYMCTILYPCTQCKSTEITVLLLPTAFSNCFQYILCFRRKTGNYFISLVPSSRYIMHQGFFVYTKKQVLLSYKSKNTSVCWRELKIKTCRIYLQETSPIEWY